MALKHFKEKEVAKMRCQFNFAEEEETMATEPIFLSSDESVYSAPCSSPDQYLAGNVSNSYDAINQIIATRQKKRSASVSTAAQYPPFPPNCLVLNDDGEENFNNITGNSSQHTH